MQGNMGYGNNQGFGPNGFMGNSNGTGNTGWSNGTGNTGWSNGWNGTGINTLQPQMQTPVQLQQARRQPDTKIIVNGRAAADAYPIPQGSTMVTLWDRNGERVFVKAYDNNGCPCVVEDYDLTPHVDPEPAYVTKDDIRDMIREALSELSLPNPDQFATKRDLEKAFSRNMPNKREKVNRNDGDA